MLDLGADVCLLQAEACGEGSLDQILKPPIGGLREGSASARSHRNPEFRCIAHHLRSYGNALVTRVTVNHRLITMQQLGGWG